MENQITVSVTGASRVELVKRLRAFADNLDGTPAGTDGKVTKTTKKAAKQSEDFDSEVTEGEQTEMDFDSGTDDTTETLEASDDSDEDFTTPSKPTKTTKAKKITVAEVNDACKARAKAGGAKGREHVLKILKTKFKTESISDIKPELYGKVIEAMQVTQ
jgi:hypothetical protein